MQVVSKSNAFLYQAHRTSHVALMKSGPSAFALEHSTYTDLQSGSVRKDNINTIDSPEKCPDLASS